MWVIELGSPWTAIAAVFECGSRLGIVFLDVIIILVHYLYVNVARKRQRMMRSVVEIEPYMLLRPKK